jgi:hydrogenase-4 membrane subunit HyfE
MGGLYNIFFSYIPVYPVSYIPLVLLLFGGLLLPEQSQENVFIIFGILVTIIGAIALNYFFRKIMKLQKSNKYSLTIFFAHLFLIHMTYLLFYGR